MSSPVAQTMPSVTLFLPSPPTGGVKAIAKAVAELLRDLGLPVQSAEDLSSEVMRFVTSGPEVRLSLRPVPLDSSLTDACERPEYGQALDQYALRKLESHRAVIGISVEDSRARPDARNRQSLALTLRLARGLIGETGADLVLWEQTKVLYTVGEFSGLGQPSKQRRPLVTQRSAAPPRPDLSGADAALAAAVAASPEPRLLRRADLPLTPSEAEGVNRRVEDLTAPLHAEALRRHETNVTPPNKTSSEAPAAAKPGPVSPSAPRLKSPPPRLIQLLSWFGQQFDQWRDEDGYPTPKMQIAVYLMTALTTALSLPIGIALFTFNLLWRESLKVTVPVLLLTSLAKALGFLDQLASPFLKLL